MSEHDDPDDIDDDASPVIKELRTQLKTLKQQNKELAEKASAGEIALRKQAFIDAGVDVSDLKAGYFVDAYKGELTKEAIAAEAVKAGFITEPDDKPDDAPALGRILDASANALPPQKAPSLDEKIAEAERAGDYVTSRLLKNQKASALMGRG